MISASLWRATASALAAVLVACSSTPATPPPEPPPTSAGLAPTATPTATPSPDQRVTGLYRTVDGGVLALFPSGAGRVRLLDLATGAYEDLASIGDPLLWSSSGRRAAPDEAEALVSGTDATRSVSARFPGAAARTATLVPVRSEEVTFTSGDVTLAGTFTTPPGTGPFPAVILVHHSDTDTRLSRTYFPYYALLLSEGYAVLAYDKRGTGRSTGRFTGPPDAGLDLLAADLVSAVEMVSRRPEVDPRRIAVLGQSQAGWVVPIAANKTQLISAAVLLAGPSMTSGQQQYFNANFGRLSEEQMAEEFGRRAGEGFDPAPLIRSMNTRGLWIYAGSDTAVPPKLGTRIVERIARETGKDLSATIFANADHFLLSTDSPRPRYVEGLFEAIRRWIKARVPLAALPTVRSGPAVAQRSSTLAEGRTTRASGTWYVEVTEERHGTEVTSHQHEAALVYVRTGTHRLTSGGRTTTLGPGQAVYIATGKPHTHAGDRGDSVLLVWRVRPASARSETRGPGRVRYASVDLPVSAMPAGAYTDTLILVSQDAGGRTSVHRHGGIEPMFVLEGEVELRTPSAPARRIAAGHGDLVLPDIPLLVLNAGSGPASFLVMLATPDGRPAQSPAELP